MVSRFPIAYAALAAFVPVALLLFRQMPRATATTVIVLSGSLLLPERVAFDLPAVPPMDKEYITYLSALVAAVMFRSGSLQAARPGRGLELLAVAMFLGIIGTALMNPNPLLDEGKVEPGLTLWWALANFGDDLLMFGVPFFLGRSMLRSESDLRAFLTILAFAGMLYTIPMVIEVAMSIPFKVFQLSQVLYGVPMRPMWRWGVIQPIVFMDNGLSLASFMALALLAACALARAGLRVFRFSATWARVVLLGGLLMTLNVAGNVYGMTFAAAFSLFSPRRIGLLAVLLACLALVYPALRSFDVFPNREIVALAYEFDPLRARSLEGRFEEEDHVLNGIGDRLWFGWGNVSRTPGAETFGRGEAGLDGWWTIRLGARGIVGVVLSFAVLGIPVLMAWRRLNALRSPRTQALLAALMAMVSIRMIDLLINGWWNNLPVFLAGVLAGVAPSLGRRRASGRPTSRAARRRPAPASSSPGGQNVGPRDTNPALGATNDPGGGVDENCEARQAQGEAGAGRLERHVDDPRGRRRADPPA